MPCQLSSGESGSLNKLPEQRCFCRRHVRSGQPPDAYSLLMRYCMKIAQARSCLLLQHSLLTACAPALLPAEQAFPSASFR